jgi:quercetin dioxygenase-like cupin family protein
LSEIPAELHGVVQLAELAEYQPGAVVSRTIVKKPCGTVTAFAFDQGEGLSEHTAAFDALVMGLDGSATLTVAGTDHIVHAGEALLLPAGKPHALRTAARFKMLLVMIRER